MFEFVFSDDFIQSLKKLTPVIQTKIKAGLAFLSKHENPLFFAKKLKGWGDVFRFRAGQYRIIFTIKAKSAVLMSVKRRKDVYRH